MEFIPMNRTRITLITFTAAALGLCSSLAQAAVVPSTDVVPPGQPAPAQERMGHGADKRDEAPPAERGMRHGRAALRFTHAHPRLFQQWMQHYRGQTSGQLHGQLERGRQPGKIGRQGPIAPPRRFAPGQPLPREEMRGHVRERIRQRVQAMPREQREQTHNRFEQRWHGRPLEMIVQPRRVPNVRPDVRPDEGRPQRDGRKGARRPDQAQPEHDMPGFRENPAQRKAGMRQSGMRDTELGRAGTPEAGRRFRGVAPGADSEGQARSRAR
jgi:hypothetical protein